jgi:hypothetical protein
MIVDNMYPLFNSVKKTLSFYSSIFLLTSLILFSSKSTAQIIDTLKRESNGSTVYTVADSDTVSQKMENGMKVTYENGIKIVGEKAFDVEIKDGILSFRGIKVNGDYVEITADVKDEFKAKGISLGDIKQKIYFSDAKYGNGVYLVFDNAIVGTFPNNGKGTKTLAGFIAPSDNSRIFLHDGAIFVTPNGSIVATTPTTLLIVTLSLSNSLNMTYLELFGKIPDLKGPNISGSADANIVFVRDETMQDGTNVVRLEIDLNTLKVRVAED